MENKYDNNLTDHEIIKTLIDNRGDKVLVPLYVKIYNDKYSLLDIMNVDKKISLNQFKIGFGSSKGSIPKYNDFPVSDLIKFNCEETFKDVDEDTGVENNYFVIEEGYYESDDENKVIEEINYWVKRLHGICESIAIEHVNAAISAYKAEYIETEEEDDNDDVDVEITGLEYFG